MAAVAAAGLAPRVGVRGPVPRWLVAASWVAAATWLQLSRSSRVPLWNSIWAEDGRFFYGEARSRAVHLTLFQPLAGYLQLVPRALAGVAAQLPTADAALAISLGAAVTCALLSVYVFVATDWLSRRWQRALLAALLVLHPAAAFEVNADLNNLHWFLMFAAFWACLSRATTGRRVAVDVVIVALAMLSDPLTLMFLPLVVARRWRASDGSRGNARWLALTFAVTALVQYVVGVAGHAPHHNSSADVTSLPAAFALRVASSAVFGDRMLVHIWRPGRHWIAYLALLVVCVLAAVAVAKSRGPARLALVAVFTYAVLFFVVPLIIRGGAAAYLRLPFRLNGSRYTIVPLWFLYSGWILWLGQWWSARRDTPDLASSRARLVPLIAAVPLTALLATNFIVAGPRSSGASWRQAVSVARRTCARGVVGPPLTSSLPYVAKPRLVSHTVVALPVPPWDDRLFWAVRLRCDQL